MALKEVMDQTQHMPQSENPQSAPAVKKRGRPLNHDRGDAILSVTLDILAERGYAGLTVSEIVARARVSKSTIYRRWATEEELAIAAFDRLPDLQVVDRGNLIDELLEIVQQYDRVLHSTPLASVLPGLVSEAMHNPALAERLRITIERRELPGKIVLKRAVERGELPQDTDIDLASELVMGPLVQRSMLGTINLDLDDFRLMLTAIVAGLNSKEFRSLKKAKPPA